MNLIVPINLQALRLTQQDPIGNDDYFAGPTTAFGSLPWGTQPKANISANIDKKLWEPAAEHLDWGIHLHWALPDGLSRSVPQADGRIQFPPAPNRWLVTRLLCQGDTVTTRQWVVESDYLMTDAEYVTGNSSYVDQTGRKSISIPVGWELNSTSDAYPYRYMGKVFELTDWPPAASPSGNPMQARYLDKIGLPPDHPVWPAAGPGPLKAVGPSGPTFAAYYPDCMSVFGFHDNFKDLADNTLKPPFSVSYQVTGWYSNAGYDPLQRQEFQDRLSQATKTNSQKSDDQKLSQTKLFAAVVQDTYGWYYDAPDQGQPERCLFGGQIAGIPWDVTKPALKLSDEKDSSIRLAIGNSTSEALAALIKENWKEWSQAQWPDSGESSSSIPPEIEQNLEFLLDALQLGLLHQLGKSQSLVQLEHALHQQGFGSLAGGKLWVIRQKQAPASDSAPYQAPQITLPDNQDGLPEKLNALNACQQRLDALLAVIQSSRRQIFLDWYKYITALYSSGDESPDKDTLGQYLTAQILDLQAKLQAAFEIKTGRDQSKDHVPVFFSGSIEFKEQGYVSDSPAASLVGQIVSQANELLALLEKNYPLFELQQTNAPRFWEPHEPVLVATGDSLQPARRNGTIKYLPCRLSGEWISRLELKADAATPSVEGSTLVETLQLKMPKPSDTEPLLTDISALLGEACLLDPTLVPFLKKQLGTGSDPANLQAAITALIGKISAAWRQGVPAKADPPIPEVLKNPPQGQATWSGTAPQGLALTFQTGDWQDPFLPLFLIWEGAYTPFQKGSDPDRYGHAYLTQSFQLDPNFIDQVVSEAAPPQEEKGPVSIQGAIPLSSRAGQALIGQIEDYLVHFPHENDRLGILIGHFRDKPLLSQGLGGFNLTMLTRSAGLQLTPFNPFYSDNQEYRAGDLGADTGSPAPTYQDCLSYFVGCSLAGQSDQMPRGEDTLYSLIRTGYLDITRLTVVDVFGRKKVIFSSTDPGHGIVPSWRLTPGVHDLKTNSQTHQVYLPPRLAQPCRLLFRWLAAESDEWEMNAHPATSPICGWVLPNHLDNSLMLFTGSGQPLGSLGVFGGQDTVTWQAAPGHALAGTEPADLAQANPHLKRFATFVHGKDGVFFQALLEAIDQAQSYILPDDKQAAQAQAVLMGRPLALVRAGLRLELMGLPAFDTHNASLQADLKDQSDSDDVLPYDWKQRHCGHILNVDFPVRLGDPNHAEDGLVAFLLDDEESVPAGEVPPGKDIKLPQTIYAPTAAASGSPSVVQPAPDTLTLKLHARIDPPAKPYDTLERQDKAQINDLTTYQGGLAGTAITMLIDPRAKVHVHLGILPVKAIELPPDQYAAALRAIEVTFFTHPILRPANERLPLPGEAVDAPQKPQLHLPLPDEAGYAWYWTTTAGDEPLQPNPKGDQAHFSYSPQLIQDGWLKLKPQPKDVNKPQEIKS